MMEDKVVDHKSLSAVANYLENNNKKIQLIYAFNGTGKTRLSREFVEKFSGDRRIIYYNSFTEDLFYWDNDLDGSSVLKIKPNRFVSWILKEQAVIDLFQEYTSNKINLEFKNEFREVTFSFKSGDNESMENVKISKGEESIFIWSIFYILLDGLIGEKDENIFDEQENSDLNNLKYIFIDDPVSSLDENHLIKLAVDLSCLIRKFADTKYDDTKFIITTHNVLFYNVVYNEIIKKNGSFLLERNDDGTFSLMKKGGDSNKSFSYHLYIKHLIEDAIKDNSIEEYHVMLLRNLYEKTAIFLGYKNWSHLLPDGDERRSYAGRIMNFYSHSSLAVETTSKLSDPEKKMVQYLLRHLYKATYYQAGSEGKDK